MWKTGDGGSLGFLSGLRYSSRLDHVVDLWQSNRFPITQGLGTLLMVLLAEEAESGSGGVNVRKGFAVG